MGRPKKWDASLSPKEINHLRYVQAKERRKKVIAAERAIYSESADMEIKAAMTAALLERGPKTLRRLCSRLITLGLAQKPDKAAIREIFDRLEGKAAQKLEVKTASQNASLDAIRSMPPHVAVQQLRDAQAQISAMLKELTACDTKQLPEAIDIDIEIQDLEPDTDAVN